MSSRILDAPVVINVKKIEYQHVVEINLLDTPLSEWCLHLCLLKEKLIESLIVNGNQRLEIILDDRLSPSSGAKANIAPNFVRLSLSANELDYCLSFFLKYYRDGVAEVDHLDIEASATINRRQEEDIYVTFRVKDAAPPMSAEEARRLLERFSN